MIKSALGFALACTVIVFHDSVQYSFVEMYILLLSDSGGYFPICFLAAFWISGRYVSNQRSTAPDGIVSSRVVTLGPATKTDERLEARSFTRTPISGGGLETISPYSDIFLTVRIQSLEGVAILGQLVRRQDFVLPIGGHLHDGLVAVTSLARNNTRHIVRRGKRFYSKSLAARPIDEIHNWSPAAGIIDVANIA
jgi:hypothetical protein